MHDPTTRQWLATKQPLRYLKGTSHYADTPLLIHIYVDVDWARDAISRHSSLAYVAFLGRNPIN